MNKTICKVDNLSFSYEKKEILSNISFSIFKNEIVGILGKNGSGKTTLLNLIMGFLIPNKGNIFIKDENINSMNNTERARNISYVQQKKLFIPDYYLVDDFIIEGRRPFAPLGFYSKEDYELFEKIIEDCELQNFLGRRVNELSGGELQRCIFARAILKQTDLFIFDEPCSAMDIKYQKDFFSNAGRIKKENNGTVLLTIHDINLAIQNCDRIIILNEGKILFDGKSGDIQSDIISKAFEITTSEVNIDNDKKYFIY